MIKKIIMGISMLTILATTSFAIETTVALELLKSDVQVVKKELIAENIGIKDKALMEKFLVAYGEYEKAEKPLLDKNLNIIKEYAKAVKTMDDATAAGLGKKLMKSRDDKTKLLRTTYKNISKQFGEVIGVRFLQLENRINLLINIQVSEEIPLIQPAK